MDMNFWLTDMFVPLLGVIPALFTGLLAFLGMILGI